MTDLTPTYIFEGDEIFAIHEGKVIASGTDMESVQSDAVDYLDSLATTREEVAKTNAKKSATHIVTPNGVKGEILGRTPAVWGEQVTVRFEQGRIATFVVHAEQEVEWVTEKPERAANPADALEQRLEAEFEHDRDSLAKRVTELQSISREAASHIANGAPYHHEVKLDKVKVAADLEAKQVKEAIDHLDSADAEVFRAPEHQVVEQAELGRSDNSWLDVTAQEMIAESEAHDFDKLLEEEPALLVSDLEPGALADAGVTRELALAHITSKTAGFQGEEVEDYRNRFIARVEVSRRQRLAAYKDATKKEAAVEQEVQSNAPDEALFM